MPKLTWIVVSCDPGVHVCKNVAFCPSAASYGSHVALPQHLLSFLFLLTKTRASAFLDQRRCYKLICLSTSSFNEHYNKINFIWIKSQVAFYYWYLCFYLFSKIITSLFTECDVIKYALKSGPFMQTSCFSTKMSMILKDHFMNIAHLKDFNNFFTGSRLIGRKSRRNLIADLLT